MSIPSVSTSGEALLELKKQAKRRAKEVPSDPSAGVEPPQHKHHLTAVARQAGFRDWQHAHAILSGQGQAGHDFGTMWLGRPAGGFLNEWFASYDEARASWSQQPSMFLLPFKTHYVIVGRDLMLHQGLKPEQLEGGLDLVAEYVTKRWQTLARQRLRALFEAP